MKKHYLFLFLIGLCAQVHAQSFTQNWVKLANGRDFAWLTNDNNATSLAYNPVSDKLLVTRRGSRIYVLNPNTGAQEDTLNLKSSVIGTEGLKYSKIRVAADGAIYALSLQTAAGVARIYRWASQKDTATLAAALAVSERAGDAFGLSGSGANTVLYVSGAGTVNNAFSIYILNTTDGKNFKMDSKVTMTSAPTTNQQWSNRVVEPEGTGVDSPIWIKGGGFVARKITLSAKDANNIRTGTVVSTVPDGATGGAASIGYGGMRLLTLSNKAQYLVFGGGNNSFAGTKMTALTVDGIDQFSLYGRDSLNTTANYVTNGNGTGDIAFKVHPNGTFTVFYISTNNGIASTTSPLPTAAKSLTADHFALQTWGNPFQQTLQLHVRATQTRNATLQIFHSTGVRQLVQPLSLQAGDNALTLPSAHWPAGWYTIVLNDGVSQQVVKAVKQ